MVEQLNKTKREMLDVYEENIDLKDYIMKSKDTSFVKECEEEIKRLKILVQ